MTQDQFHNWLGNPSTMDTNSIPQLREVIKRYPYFQLTQVLLAKNLKQENHIDQLKQLQLAAVMVPDRKVFHDHLYDKKKSDRTKQQLAQENPEPAPEPTLPKDEQPEKTEHLLPDELIPEPIIYQLETADLPELPPREPEQTQMEEPAELSFSGWLSFTESGRLDSEKTVAPKKEEPQEKHSSIELIDHFLTRADDLPKKRAEFFNPQKAGAKSLEEDFTVVSETLANIYFQQEKYELANQAYQALSLKYPEKSVYFAARLKEIDEKLNSEN